MSKCVCVRGSNKSSNSSTTITTTMITNNTSSHCQKKHTHTTTTKNTTNTHHHHDSLSFRFPLSFFLLRCFPFFCLALNHSHHDPPQNLNKKESKVPHKRVVHHYSGSSSRVFPVYFGTIILLCPLGVPRFF